MIHNLFYSLLHTLMMAAAAPAPRTLLHWTIHNSPESSQGLATYKVSREDLPGTGTTELRVEHLVWAGALSPGDRIKMVGLNRTDDVFTVEEIPPTDTWLDAGNEKIYKRDDVAERISRKEIEQENGVRGLDGWAVDLRDEGWTPLTIVTERLIHFHMIIDSWKAQKQAKRS